MYALHRWISALALLQLAAWSVSGLYFAVVPIEPVRGTGVEGAHEEPISVAPGAVTPATALACFAAAGQPTVSRLELRASSPGLHYIGRAGHHAMRLDARNCAPAPVLREEAERIALRDQPPGRSVVSAELVERDPLVEYRGKPLPAWRVELDEDAIAIYVDARIGDVTARRNGTWRTYDFLWSLHIMDYGKRESFNHALLIAAAAMAVLTSASGAALWIVRLWRRFSRSPRASSPD